MNFEPAGRIHRTKRNGEEFACATIIETHEEKEHRQECLCHYWPGSGGIRLPGGQNSHAPEPPPHPPALKPPAPARGTPNPHGLAARPLLVYALPQTTTVRGE